MGKTQVFKWFFISILIAMHHKPPSGQPNTSKTDKNVRKVQEFVLIDRSLVSSKVCLKHLN